MYQKKKTEVLATLVLNDYYYASFHNMSIYLNLPQYILREIIHTKLM